MSISSSLNASVMGLSVNSSRLSTISDNIANSSTYGYKRSAVEFSSLVVDQSSSTYSAGGVTSTSYKDISATGSLTSTSSSTDISVSGDGLIPVTDEAGSTASASERSLMLTSTGSFYVDEDGYLRTQSGLFMLGWPTDSTGDTGNVSRSSGADLEAVNVSASQYSASPTTSIDIGINLPADATTAGSSGDSYTLPIEYYDNLGRTQTLTLEFTPVVASSGSSNEWNVTFYDSAGDELTSLGDLNLVFDDSTENGGSIASATASGGITYDATTGTLSVTLESGPVEVYIGSPGDESGITQLAGEFSPTNVTADGSPIGDLSSIEIDDNGYLQAVYDTGQIVTLYQIPLGNVPNTNGLTALDSQAYAVSSSSGSIYFWDAGTGPVGTLSGYSLMESTTDIAEEMTDLIETQRAYSSNAKIVQTVDEMLEETTNLKR